MTTRARNMLKACTVTAGLLFTATTAQAQVQRSFINLGFEQPALAPNSCYIITSAADVPGWETTHPVYPRSGSCTSPTGSAGPSIELWRNLGGTGPRTGLNHAELNAHVNSRIYQSVCLANGEVVDWRLSHRGRGGTDVMSFNIDSVANQIVRTSTTAAGVGTVVAGSCGTGSVGGASCNAPATVSSWADYSGSFVWNGVSGNHSFGFEAISTGSGNAASGNFLDEIVVILRPYVEFFPASTSTRENQGATGVPAIRVTGHIETAFDVVVSITGGTAVLGTDFSAPGATFSVTIPAGDYGAGQSFPLPLSAIDDAVIEDNRTVTLAIVENPDDYVVGSTSNCGAAANAAATWTIVDNDVDLATEKSTSDATPAVGQPFTYTVSYVNNTARPLTAPLDAHDVTATIADLPPAGVSFDSWTCAASGGATCPAASGVGAINASALLPAGAAAAGGRLTYTITATLDGSSVCSAIQNTATIAAPAGTGEGTSAATDFDTPPPGGSANNTATADVSTNCADLRIEKTNPDTEVESGASTTYTITVTNDGPSAADNAVVSDDWTTVPGLDCSAGPLTCVASGTAGTQCPAAVTPAQLQAGVAIPVLPSGGVVTFALTCEVTATGE